MKPIDPSGDVAHRELAEQLIRESLAGCGIHVDELDFEGREYEGYSWLCYVIDPRAEDRRAPYTGKSAADHLRHIDPNGLLAHRDEHVRVSVTELEVSEEASFTLLDEDGQPELISPWLANLAVARATFTFRVEGKTLRA